jgi:hypothetical protein
LEIIPLSFNIISKVVQALVIKYEIFQALAIKLPKLLLNLGFDGVVR